MAMFVAGTTVSVGTRPISNATADVDGDGHLDLLVTNYTSDTISVLLGNGLGGFAPAPTPTVAVTNGPRTVKVGDFDGDGDIDILATNLSGNNVTVALNSGTGTFTTSSVTVDSGPRGLEVGDLDGDGDLDFVTSNYNANTLSIALSNGDGTFAAPASVTSGGTQPAHMAIADLNGDGRLDLVASNRGSGTVGVLLGNGNGTFAAAATFATDSQPRGVTTGDVDGDGDNDIVVVNYGAATATVLLNNGSGSFTTGATLSTGSNPYDVKLGDLDGDGDLDMVVNNAAPVNVFLNDGSGVFTEASGSPFPVGGGGGGIALGDFDEDGDLDVSASSFSSNSVSVLINTSAIYSVVATSTNENAAGAEIVYTITRTAKSHAETLTYSLGGTATSGADYTAPSGTVNFAVGALTAEIHVVINNDKRAEPDETVVITLDSTSGEGRISGTNGQATGTIFDNDPPPPPPNEAPVISSANADANAQTGISLSLLIGDGHFMDADKDDLNYTITVNGGAIPAWLTFDAETGALTGTPTAAEAGTYVIAVKASDGSASSPTDEFNLIVSNPVTPDPKGTRGNDKLVGNAGDNIMDGKRGNDRLTGADGADTFVFSKGHDKVRDFDANEGDVIDLAGAIGINSYSDLVNHHIASTDAGIKIMADDGSWMLVKGLHEGDLTAGMFVF